MRWRLDDGLRRTPEEMARLSYRLCAFGIWWSLGLDTPRPPLPTQAGRKRAKAAA